MGVLVRRGKMLMRGEGQWNHSCGRGKGREEGVAGSPVVVSWKFWTGVAASGLAVPGLGVDSNLGPGSPAPWMGS